MISKNKYLRFKSVIGGWRVFAAVLILFGAGSVALAATADFPLPYDEQYHFTLIQYYSHQLSPFITTQPVELSTTGDATRYGSYLSHYLLSFPLRLIALSTSDIQTQVVLLRLINIGFVIGAFVLFRKFVIGLLKSGVAANISVALLAALPVTAFLAATINYDNLILLLFAGLLVMAQMLTGQANSDGRVRAPLLLGFVASALLACLVKFTFLPLAAVMLAFMVTVVVRRKAWPKAALRMNSSGILLVAMVGLCVVAIGLFSERHMGNMVAYKSLQPDCSAVQSLNVCLQYGPWERNYGLAQAAVADTALEGRSIQGYVANIWAPLMIRGLGGVNNQGIVAELPKPLLVAMITAVIALVGGAIGAAVMYRKNSLVLMTVIAMGLYTAALLQRNYSEFMSLHEIVAVQGRYIVPFVVPLSVIGFMGITLYVRRSKLALQNVIWLARLSRSISPDEAYERSLNYWSSKLWRRRSTDS